MADNKIVVEMTGQEASMLRTLNRLSLSNEDLYRKVKELEAGYNAAGRAGEAANNRVEKATGPAAKAIWEQDRAIRKVKSEWEEAAKAADQAGKQQSGMVESGIAGVKRLAAGAMGVATAFVSIRTAISAAKAEYENLLRLQGKSAEVQIDVASSRMDVNRNLINVSDSDRQRTHDAAKAISSSSGVGEGAINQALASALSASGGNINASISAVGAAAKMLPDKPGDLGLYAGSMLDLSKVTGSTDASVNMGLLSTVGGMSRVSNPQQQAQNIPKALIGVKGFGGSAGESAALFSALSIAGADFQGAEAGTASVQLARQLRDFLPESGVAAKTTGGLSEAERMSREKLLASKDYKRALERRASGETLTDDQIRALKEEEGYVRSEKSVKTTSARPGLSTFGQRLAYLQSNPEMAKAFLAESSFEAKMLSPIEQLLNPASDVAGEYRKNVGMVPDNAALARAGQGVIDSLSGDPLAAQAKRKRTYTTAQEQLHLANLVGAEGGINREGVKDILLASGQGALATKMDMMSWEWASDIGRNGGTDKAIEMIANRSDRLRNPVDYAATTGGMGFAPAGSFAQPRKATQQENEQADILDKMLEELRKIAAGQEKSRPPALAKPDVDK